MSPLVVLFQNPIGSTLVEEFCPTVGEQKRKQPKECCSALRFRNTARRLHLIGFSLALALTAPQVRLCSLGQWSLVGGGCSCPLSRLPAPRGQFAAVSRSASQFTPLRGAPLPGFPFPSSARFIFAVAPHRLPLLVAPSLRALGQVRAVRFIHSLRLIARVSLRSMNCAHNVCLPLQTLRCSYAVKSHPG